MGLRSPEEVLGGSRIHSEKSPPSSSLIRSQWHTSCSYLGYFVKSLHSGGAFSPTKKKCSFSFLFQLTYMYMYKLYWNIEMDNLFWNNKSFFLLNYKVSQNTKLVLKSRTFLGMALTYLWVSFDGTAYCHSPVNTWSTASNQWTDTRPHRLRSNARQQVASVRHWSGSCL